MVSLAVKLLPTIDISSPVDEYWAEARPDELRSDWPENEKSHQPQLKLEPNERLY